MNFATVEQLGWGMCLLGGLMFGLWLVERWSRNAGIVDVGWSAGVGLMSVYLALSTTTASPARRWLVGLMAGVWSLRLAHHLLVDRVLGKPEDGRYQTLRRRWGSRAGAYFFLFFQAQAVLAFLFALPMLLALHAPRTGLGWPDLVGVAIWLLAIGGETLADYQLARFRRRADSHGKTCREGLWRYSRHPNYFFEWLHWWSYVALAIGAPLGWLSLAAPALMLLFLFKVTGIPATEAQAVASRGEDYRQYQRTTSAFVPWFPRKDVA